MMICKGHVEQLNMGSIPCEGRGLSLSYQAFMFDMCEVSFCEEKNLLTYLTWDEILNPLDETQCLLARSSSSIYK
jgi:hypothetical protein